MLAITKSKKAAKNNKQLTFRVLLLQSLAL